LAGIALGAIYMVLNQAPVAKPVKTEKASRTLAYHQNAISGETGDAKTETEGEAKPSDTPEPPPLPAEAEAKPETPPPPTPKPKEAAKPAPKIDLPPDGGAQPNDSAALPPTEDGAYPDGGGEPLPWQTDSTAVIPNDGGDLPEEAPAYGEAPPYDPAAGDEYGVAPPDPYDQGQEAFDQAYADQNGGPPPGAYGRQPYGQPAPGQPPYGQAAPGPYGQQPPADPYADPYAQPRQQGAYGQPPSAQPYGQPQGAQPYGQPGDPYAQQAAPGAPGEEWVQVMVSGTGMRSTASLDSPILFAFPFGRNLRVVSRDGEWVQVADPQSSATGWMKAEMLGPGAPPGQPGYGQQDAYYDQPVEERRPGLFRKGGFADMINRAFGGGN
jgi:hypothetical protein